MQLHRIAGRFYNSPLLLSRSSANVISAFLLSEVRARAGSRGGSESDSGSQMQGFNVVQRQDGSVEYHAARASRFYGDYPVDSDAAGRPKPYRRTAQGTAIVTLVGEFVNRGAWIGADSGLISYEGYRYQMVTAAHDPRTRNILLDIESPGGEAIGAFEAAALTREVAAVKPVVALVNGMACSAAYAIASGARSIVTLPTGISGSIGVVMMHLDFSKYLEIEGIKPTMIFAGAQKVDGNPFEALPEDVRARFEREVMGFYDQFVETVAAGRKGLNEKAIRATEAGIFKGQEAIEAGLADDIGTFEDVLSEMSA